MNNFLTFQEADPDQIADSFKIIQACAAYLLDKWNLDHWSSYYSDLETYKHKIETNNSELFIVYLDGKPAATVTISENPPSYYIHPEFGPYDNFIQFFSKVEPEDSVLYITALGVHPDFQGRDISKFLMAKIEDLARQRGIKAIRFDTRLEFTPAVNLYESLGYKKVFKDVVSETENYNYYEKLL